jgi:acetoin utilization protein AcuB
MAKSVSDIMTKNLKTLEPEATLDDANQIMKDAKVRHIPIVEKATNKLLGIISDRDVKKFLSPFIGSPREQPQDKATLNIQVGKIMVKTVQTVTAEDDVKTVAEKMLQKRVASIPVVDDAGKLVGIVSTTDLIRLLVGML